MGRVILISLAVTGLLAVVGYVLHPLVTLYELRDYEPIDPQEFVEKIHREAAARNPSPHDVELIERCGEGEYILAHTFDEELKACFQGFLKDRIRPRAEFQAKVVSLFHKGECEAAFDLIEEEEGRSGQWWRPQLDAELAYHGLCVPQDKVFARHYWEQQAEHSLIAVELAYLSEIYWKGEAGVAPDSDKARDYARLAALAGLPNNSPHAMVFYGTARPYGLYDDIWGLSENEMAVQFASYLTGPRDLVPPLLEQQDWLKRLLEDDGALHVEAAVELRHEWQSLWAAIGYLKSATFNDYAPAYYKLYEWKLDAEMRDFYNDYYTQYYSDFTPEQRVNRRICDAYNDLIWAAERGHDLALLRLNEHFSKFSPSDRQERRLWREEYEKLLNFAAFHGITLPPPENASLLPVFNGAREPYDWFPSPIYRVHIFTDATCDRSRKTQGS